MSLTTTSSMGRALVFQCSCKSILSDSVEFVCTLEAPGDGAECVVVRGVSEARVDRIAHTASHDGSGSGSSGRTTHFSVCCGACGAAVGRVYSEVPPALAPIRNLFCLEVSRCISYELGSAEVRASGSSSGGQAQQQRQQQQRRQDAAAGRLGSLGGDDQQQSGGAAPAAGMDTSLVLDLLQRVEQLEASLCTLQGIQVLHDSQLRTLPGYQGDAEFAEEAATAAAAIS